MSRIHFGLAALGSGTPDATTYLRGDGSWAAPAGGGSAFPVGAVFLSVVSTNPATLLGYGTWAAIAAGRVLVGLDAGDPAFDVVEETGGAKTVASAGTVAVPSFTGAALDGHTHGPGTLVPSAHAGTGVSAHAGTAVGDHASHTHTYTQVPNHTHPHNLQGGTTNATTGTHVTASTATGGSSRAMGIATSDPTGGVATGTTAGPNASLTHTVTQPNAHTVTQPNSHTMAGASSSDSAGTPAGSVSAPAFTGSATSVVQPYFVVYVWKRTA